MQPSGPSSSEKPPRPLTVSTRKSPTAWMFDKSVKGLIHEIDEMATKERRIYDGLARLTDDPITEVTSADCSNKSCFECTSRLNVALHCPVCGALIPENNGWMFNLCKCGAPMAICMGHFVMAAAKTTKLFSEEDTI